MKTVLIAAALVVLPSMAFPCERPYVLQIGEHDSMCGDTARMERVERRHRHDDFFWFERDGRSYIVTDRATIDRISAMFEPITELGRQQSALGRQQSALGRQQSELGSEQSRLGREQAHADSDGQRELSRQQRELSEQQSELGRRQSELGRQQSELGRRQSAVAHEVEHRLIPIEDDLIRDGIATRD